MMTSDDTSASGAMSSKAGPAASALNTESVGGTFASLPTDTTTVNDVEVSGFPAFHATSS